MKKIFIILAACFFCYVQDAACQEKSSTAHAPVPPKAGRCGVPRGSTFLDYISKMRDEFGVKSGELLGKGRQVFAGGSISDSRYSVKFCAQQEQFLDEAETFGVEAQHASLDDKRYKQITPAAGIYIYSQMDKYTKFSTEFKYSQPEIYHLQDTADAAIRRYGGENQVTALLLRCENSPVDKDDYPSYGRKSDLNFEISSKEFGSDFNFFRTTAHNAFYYSPRKGVFSRSPLNGLTFVLNGQFGAMRKFGGEDEIPFFERLYAGGTGTVRGYRYRYLAPQDAEGLPIGGNCTAVLTGEMRYPVYKDIKGAIFYDQGNAWKKTEDFNLTDTKAGIGAGLRWVTRFGAARLDYGYGLNSGTRQRGGRLHLSLGMKF